MAPGGTVYGRAAARPRGPPRAAERRRAGRGGGDRRQGGRGKGRRRRPVRAAPNRLGNYYRPTHRGSGGEGARKYKHKLVAVVVRQVHDQHALLGRRQRAQHLSGRQVQDARRAAEDAVALPEAQARQGLPSDAVRAHKNAVFERLEPPQPPLDCSPLARRRRDAALAPHDARRVGRVVLAPGARERQDRRAGVAVERGQLAARAREAVGIDIHADAQSEPLVRDGVAEALEGVRALGAPGLVGVVEVALVVPRGRAVGSRDELRIIHVVPSVPRGAADHDAVVPPRALDAPPLRLLGVARHAGGGVEQIARERHLRQHDQHDAVQGSAVQEGVAFRSARVGLAVDRLQLDAGHPAARWCSAHLLSTACIDVAPALLSRRRGVCASRA